MCRFPVVPALLLLGGVLGRRCARSVCGVASTVSWASWLLFTGVHPLCVVIACTASCASWLLFTVVDALCVVLRARFAGPPGSYSPVCTLSVWCCGCGVLSRLVPVHQRARSLSGVACAVSWAAWLLFTGVPAFMRCVVCTVSWVPWFRFTGVHALCAVLYVRRPGPPGSCSPVRVLAVCSSHASYLPPSSLLVLVHALLDCPPAYSCRRCLVLVAPLAFAFESPSVVVRPFGLSFSSFPLALVLLVPPPHLTLLLPLLSATVSPPLQSVPVRAPCAHPPPILLLLLSLPTSCSFSSRFASSLLLVLPLPFLALVLVLLSVLLRRRLLLLVCRPVPSIPGPLRPRMFQYGCVASPDFPVRGTGCTPGLFVVFPPLPRTLQSIAPGSPPDDSVRGLGPCFIPPRMLQSGASFCRILSVASDAPSRGTGFTPGRSSPGISAVLRSASDAPFRGVFLSYSLRCLGRTGFSPGRSSPAARALLHSAPDAPIPGVCLSYSLLCPGRSSPWSVAPGSPPDDPVRGLMPCFMPPRMLQSGASFHRILSVASDAPVRGTGFTPGRSSPGASAVLHSAPDAPIRAVFLSYSLCCLGCSGPWHRVHPRTIQSGG